MAAQTRPISPIPLTGLDAQRQTSATIRSTHPPRHNSYHPPRYTSSQSSANVSGQPPLRSASYGKPLPRLPRGWARICHETSLFLRSIGLGIIVSTLSGLFSKGFSEPTKVAVRRNRVTALSRALIHAVPLGVALLEIILNWKYSLVGPVFTKQFYYQVAAKAHEITIQASLTFIVLSYIRYALTIGSGLPFGTLIGGLQFLQVSYLWSTELWASITSKHIPLKKKISLLLLVIVCSTLAATVGPASATLLIPRQINWPLKSSRFAIKSTFQDIWPDRLSGEDVPIGCTLLPQFDVVSLCPAGDWYGLHVGLKSLSQSTMWDIANKTHSQVYGLSDPKIGFDKITEIQICESSIKDQICGSSRQNIVMEGAYINNKHWEVKQQENREKAFIDISHYITADYYQPYVLSSCFSDTITYSTRDEPLQFPRISETKEQLLRDRVIVTVPNTTKAEVLYAPGNVSEFRLKWVELPSDLFNDTSFAAVILHPHEKIVDTAFDLNVTTCTLSAGWGTSAIQQHQSSGPSYFSTITNTPKSWPVHDDHILGYGFTSRPDYGNLSGFAYPQRRVQVSADWAEYLNPAIAISENSSSTVMHLLLSAVSVPPTETVVAHVLTALVASGLGRNGIQLKTQDIWDDLTLCDGCLAFEVEHNIITWAYTNKGTTMQIAVAVMMVYCILAFAHIIYLGISGISSTAWDSIAEIVALAMNSSPTKHLQNTCAGIFGSKTFQIPVKIMVTNGGSGKDEHLELVFGVAEQRNAQMSRMEANKKYGTLHAD